MTYFFTPQRPRQPDDDDGGIFNTVMKYVGQAGKGAIIGGIAGGAPGAKAGAALGFFGVSEGGTAAGAKFYSDKQKEKPDETAGLSPMGQLGPDSSSWIAKLSGMSALG